MVVQQQILLPKEGVDGFLIGAISTFVVSAIMNERRVKSAELSKEAAASEVLKETLFGGVALGSTSLAVSALHKKNYVKAVGGVALGGAIIYGIEKISANKE